ncbi:hypothetical protein DFH11DRAFT_131631 [Phellopilus nigrolimitatus]|nr:hypothetical protein DFH11DRAFT_131631 [Phellopilus nigrolimitatus]
MRQWSELPLRGRRSQHRLDIDPDPALPSPMLWIALSRIPDMGHKILILRREEKNATRTKTKTPGIEFSKLSLYQRGHRYKLLLLLRTASYVPGWSQREEQQAPERRRHTAGFRDSGSSCFTGLYLLNLRTQFFILVALSAHSPPSQLAFFELAVLLRTHKVPLYWKQDTSCLQIEPGFAGLPRIWSDACVTFWRMNSGATKHDG